MSSNTQLTEQIIHVSNLIYDIKDKITDNEFITINECLMQLHKQLKHTLHNNRNIEDDEIEIYEDDDIEEIDEIEEDDEDYTTENTQLILIQSYRTDIEFQERINHRYEEWINEYANELCDTEEEKTEFLNGPYNILKNDYWITQIQKCNCFDTLDNYYSTSCNACNMWNCQNIQLYILKNPLLLYYIQYEFTNCEINNLDYHYHKYFSKSYTPIISYNDYDNYIEEFISNYIDTQHLEGNTNFSSDDIQYPLTFIDNNAENDEYVKPITMFISYLLKTVDTSKSMNKKQSKVIIVIIMFDYLTRLGFFLKIYSNFRNTMITKIDEFLENDETMEIINNIYTKFNIDSNYLQELKHNLQNI